MDFKIHASFGILLVIGIFYPLVDAQTYLNSILSWRKFLLLPIGYILFQNRKIQKDKALKIIFYFIFGLTIINLIYKLNILNFFKPGIIAYQIGTTSSEGMFVAVALAIALSSALNNANASMTEKILKYSAAAYFIFYIILFTTGRSGYLAMLIVENRLCQWSCWYLVSCWQ
jgi:hypothetical protein